jgi:hypothetical protein
MASWMKESIALKPFGERSVFDEILSRKAITVSPMFIWLIEAIKSAELFFDCRAV